MASRPLTIRIVARELPGGTFCEYRDVRVGLQVQTADAPWVLLHEPGLRERLAPRGVLVRDCASFGLPGVARMAVPDSPGLDRVATALARA